MATRAELEKLKEGDKVLVGEIEVKFLYLIPCKYNGGDYSVLTQSHEDRESCHRYTIGSVTIPKPITKCLGEVAWYKCVNAHQEYPYGVHQLWDIKDVLSSRYLWQRVEITDGKVYEYKEQG